MPFVGSDMQISTQLTFFMKMIRSATHTITFVKIAAGLLSSMSLKPFQNSLSCRKIFADLCSAESLLPDGSSPRRDPVVHILRYLR